jgi:hypothetical protein
MSIQKCIHNIWIQGYDFMPDDIKNSIKEKKKLNPSWQYIVWDETMILKLLELYPKLLNIYNNIDAHDGMISSLTSKSDIARFAIIRTHGGVYFDVDFVCDSSFSSFDNLFSGEDMDTIFIASSEIDFIKYLYPFKKPKYCACFFGMRKNHPVWDDVFECIYNAKTKRDIGESLDQTLQQNKKYKTLPLSMIKTHYSCESKFMCHTPSESSWNAYRPLLQYINCNQTKIIIILCVMLFLSFAMCIIKKNNSFHIKLAHRKTRIRF